MSRSKILILSDWYLPAVKAGGPVKSVAAIAKVLKSDCDVFILTSDRDIGSEKPFPSISYNEWLPIDGVQIKYCSPREIKKQIRKELKGDYHRIYLNSFFSIYFTILPLVFLSIQNQKWKVIIAPRGMLGGGAMALKSMKKKLFIHTAKLLGLYRNVLWHASTTLEEKEIKAVFPKAQVRALRNLSNLEYQSVRHLQKNVGDLNLVFLSRISPKKNLKFVLELLHSCNASIKLDIYGPIEDNVYWEDCLQLMKSLKQEITYQGVVNANELSALYQNYHFFVLPTLNENFGHVVLESLNYSCPVILSDQTPWDASLLQDAGFALSLDNRDGWLSLIDKLHKMDHKNYMLLREGANNLARLKLNQGDLAQDYISLFAKG